MLVQNFGRNVCFEPATYLEPADERELITQLTALPDGPVRVIGSGHAWSPLIATSGTLVSLQRLQSIRVLRHADGRVSVEIGAGCRIKDVVAELNRHGLTLPSLGLINEQRIAGAISTGTHGSGRHSLSHYVEAVQVVRYLPGAGWESVTISRGDELRAARCSLGCLGIITSVQMECRPQYWIDESWASYATLPEILQRTAEYPLQQFFLLPHRWDWVAQHRREVVESSRSDRLASLYRWYFHLTFDWGMHLGIVLSARWLQSRTLTRLLCRVLPNFVIRGWTVRDRSDRHLVMEHELFRHLETEVFVRELVVREAAEYVATVLQVADGAPCDRLEVLRPRLEALGVWPALEALRGRFTHHYPVCFRRVLADDTLLSMTAGDAGPWYSISLITYVEPRDDFFAVVEYLARTMVPLFNARLHWGKHVPLEPANAAAQYPELARFTAVVQALDPVGRVQNEFTRSVLSACLGEARRD